MRVQIGNIDIEMFDFVLAVMNINLYIMYHNRPASLQHTYIHTPELDAPMDLCLPSLQQWALYPPLKGSQAAPLMCLLSLLSDLPRESRAESFTWSLNEATARVLAIVEGVFFYYFFFFAAMQAICRNRSASRVFRGFRDWTAATGDV